MASSPPPQPPPPPSTLSSSSRGSPLASPVRTPAPASGVGLGLGPTPLPQRLWALRIPVYVTHASRPGSPPFVASVPRFSYLALLLPRLAAFFGAPCSSFHHEEIQLRNLAVGLLVDLYRPPALPWRLVVADGPQWDIGDTFMNAAKEADFVRNGNAKQIMSLSKENTTALWNAVQDGTYITSSSFLQL